jgi:LPXTG-motif cell wall-anchored protein
VSGAIGVDTSARSTATQGATANGSTALANTGMDASLVPLALLLLVAGLLVLLRKRKVS